MALTATAGLVVMRGRVCSDLVRDGDCAVKLAGPGTGTPFFVAGLSWERTETTAICIHVLAHIPQMSNTG